MSKRSPEISISYQPWDFFGRNDAKAETPVLWPPDSKNWLLGKDPDAGKDRRWEKTGTTEDEMVGWHQWLDGHEFEQVLGVDDGQGNLACCSPWGCKELDTTERLNWTDIRELSCNISSDWQHLHRRNNKSNYTEIWGWLSKEQSVPYFAIEWLHTQSFKFLYVGSLSALVQ